jgi:hypothetical protein
MSCITARPRLLSVTESPCAPASTEQAVRYPILKSSIFREWLVPSVLLPIFFGLMIAAAVVIQW